MALAFASGSGGGGGGVSSVTAADTSIVVAGTASNPTVATATLDVIAADHPAAADWSNNSHKITSLANGTAASDAAAFGQITAANAAAEQNDGWISTTDTWTYASSTTFTISGVNRTAVFTPGTRLRLTQTTVKYLVVVSSSFSTNTTVTVTGGSDYSLANAAITSPFYSYDANPQGYPGWFNFTPASSGFSSTSVDKGRFSVVGRTCFLEYESNGTSNATTLGFTLPIAWSGNGAHNQMPVHYVQDNSAVQTTTGYASLTASSTSCACNKNMASVAWTASGNKIALIQSYYEI